jgi:VanZ like protein
VVSVGGPWVMLLGALVAGVVCVLLAVATSRRLGRLTAWSLAALLWSLVVIGLVTLVPANGPTSFIPADQAQTSCSWDFGGPAPSGFWIFSGGQRLLNTALFVPAGFLLAFTVGRGRHWWLALPGLLALAGYSALIERTQLGLARLDRACDVTDVVDNTVGAVVGCVAGLVVAALVGLAHRRRDRRVTS